MKIFDWFKSRRLANLEKRLFDLEWSYPPKTYSFEESQITMFGRQNRIDSIKSEIEKLKSSTAK